MISNNILKQWEIAKKVLSDVHVIDPNAIIAGGAPRDWLEGKECNDIDIYFTSSHESGVKFAKAMGKLGYECTQLGRDAAKTEEPYGDLPGLRFVLTTVVNGQEVQFISMEKEDRFETVRNFDSSICMAYIEDATSPSPVIETEKLYDLALAAGVVVYKQGLRNTKHLDRMRSRYPDKIFICISEIGIKEEWLLPRDQGTNPIKCETFKEFIPWWLL